MNTTHQIGFTHQQMMDLGFKIGVTWKGRDYTPENGHLSDAVVQAITELGTTNLEATLRRASQIQQQAESQRYESQLTARQQQAKARLASLATTPHGLSIAQIIAHQGELQWSMEDLIRLSYAIRYYSPTTAGLTAAEGEQWRTHTAGLTAVLDLMETNQETTETQPSHQNRTQLWEPCQRCGTEPSYATPQGHLCTHCH